MPRESGNGTKIPRCAIPFNQILRYLKSIEARSRHISIWMKKVMCIETTWVAKCLVNQRTVPKCLVALWYSTKCLVILGRLRLVHGVFRFEWVVCCAIRRVVVVRDKISKWNGDNSDFRTKRPAPGFSLWRRKRHIPEPTRRYVTSTSTLSWTCFLIMFTKQGRSFCGKIHCWAIEHARAYNGNGGWLAAACEFAKFPWPKMRGPSLSVWGRQCLWECAREFLGKVRLHVLKGIQNVRVTGEKLYTWREITNFQQFCCESNLGDCSFRLAKPRCHNQA